MDFPLGCKKIVLSYDLVALSEAAAEKNVQCMSYDSIATVYQPSWLVFLETSFVAFF